MRVIRTLPRFMLPDLTLCFTNAADMLENTLLSRIIRLVLAAIPPKTIVGGTHFNTQILTITLSFTILGLPRI